VKRTEKREKRKENRDQKRGRSGIAAAETSKKKN
jgi:hypothetical protein